MGHAGSLPSHQRRPTRELGFDLGVQVHHALT